VIQAVNKELKQLKNQEKKAQPEAFKGAHYALLKNQQDLTSKRWLLSGFIELVRR